MVQQRSVVFGVLGTLQIGVDGSSVQSGTPKQRAVLATLLINRNSPVAIESLISAAWEQRPPPGARANIHAYVSNLRRVLAGAGVDPRTVLVKESPGYRINVADGDIDLGRFIREKTAGIRAAAGGRFERATDHLSAALAEWRGPVLEDLRDFEFVGPFATALEEAKLVAHTAYAEAEIACGRGDAVVDELEALVAEHPYREPIWAQLITAYYLGDRQSDALAAYQRLKTTLVDDLGIDPSPKLRALHERVLRQERLDVQQAAKTAAADTVVALDQRAAVDTDAAVALLRDAAGRFHPLQAVATRIGRLADNEIILDDPDVSRRHAIIVDTGTSFVITDLRSANGVEVQRERIRTSATLTDGDHIRICDHEFTFEIQSCGGELQ